MKLISLELKNFRQFHSDHSLVFATGDAGRNVTVIHGHNGSGKTALLNAFVWCLYGDTTPDLEAPERLENERAVAEAVVDTKVEVQVRMTYEAPDAIYIVERSRRSTKAADGPLGEPEEDLRMWRKTAGGQLESYGQHAKERQLRINQLLPESLYPFFFFNGERVERLASVDAYDRVETGIKTLLNVKIFERSVDHLRRLVALELSRELRAYSDEDLRRKLDEQEELQNKHDATRVELEGARAEIDKLEEEIEEYERKQTAIAALQQLGERRAKYREQLQRLEQEDLAIGVSLRRALSDDGYLAFAADIFGQTENLITSARQRGDIPAKIKPQFVDDLLEASRCVCGRDLPPGSPEREALLKWKEATGLADLEETISQTAARIGPMRLRAARFQQEAARLQATRSELLSRRRECLKDLAIVEQEIGDRSSDEDAAALASRLAELRRDLSNRHSRVLMAERDLREYEDRLHELRGQIRQLQAREARGALLKKQIEAVNRIADVLESVFTIQKNTVRQVLDKQISEIWRDAAIKDYRASVTDDYRLVLTKKVGGVEQVVLGASTGEKQVLALSFVASLVRALLQGTEEPETARAMGLAVGGTFPLVMDSPFGSLEDYYRQKVAEWVPKLAEQVVLMVSTTQWRDEAENALAGKIGKEYILELHTPKEKMARTIAIREKDYPYVVSSRDPFEFTTLQEVV